MGLAMRYGRRGYACGGARVGDGGGSGEALWEELLGKVDQEYLPLNPPSWGTCWFPGPSW